MKAPGLTHLNNIVLDPCTMGRGYEASTLAIKHDRAAQADNRFLLGAMNTAKDSIIFFRLHDQRRVCHRIRASSCEGMDCTFEAIECVGGAIHGYLERLVVIVPASLGY